MAVKKSKKKKKKKVNKIKSVSEEIASLKQDVSKIECVKLDDEVENKKINRLYVLFLIVMGLVLLVMFFPRIKLVGEENIVISYNDEYIENGYYGYVFNKDISGDVRVVNNVNNGVIGNYEVNYYIDLFGAKVKKTRYVNVVDRDIPIINVESNTIKVCPNQEIDKFDYMAVDEYDGDLTSLVEKEIFDDKILLSVSDSSLNSSELIINIDRVDNEAPVIKLNGNSTMYLKYGNSYSEPGYTVSDNCSSNLVDKVVVSGNVLRKVGTYTLTYEVYDESGNKGVATRKVIVGADLINNGVINKGSIYLTFDDGPNSGTTNRILDILKDEGVKATFFVTCNGPDGLIKRMYDEGHMVALHTATHNYSYIYSSVDNYFSDLYKVRDRVKRITGFDSKIIRFPGGSSNTISRNYKTGIMSELAYLVLNEGYRYYDWNIDSMDASTARSSDDIYYNVTSKLSMNSSNMVLMHDTKNMTASALRDIIRFGKEYGYSFKTIDVNTYMIRHGIKN